MKARHVGLNLDGEEFAIENLMLDETGRDPVPPTYWLLQITLETHEPNDVERWAKSFDCRVVGTPGLESTIAGSAGRLLDLLIDYTSGDLAEALKLLQSTIQ